MTNPQRRLTVSAFTLSLKGILASFRLTVLGFFKQFSFQQQQKADFRGKSSLSFQQIADKVSEQFVNIVEHLAEESWLRQRKKERECYSSTPVQMDANVASGFYSLLC